MGEQAGHGDDQREQARFGDQTLIVEQVVRDQLRG